MKLRKNLMDRLNKRLMRAEGKVNKLETGLRKLFLLKHKEIKDQKYEKEVKGHGGQNES